MTQRQGCRASARHCVPVHLGQFRTVSTQNEITISDKRVWYLNQSNRLLPRSGNLALITLHRFVNKRVLRWWPDDVQLTSRSRNIPLLLVTRVRLLCTLHILRQPYEMVSITSDKNGRVKKKKEVLKVFPARPRLFPQGPRSKQRQQVDLLGWGIGRGGEGWWKRHGTGESGQQLAFRQEESPETNYARFNELGKI